MSGVVKIENAEIREMVEEEEMKSKERTALIGSAEYLALLRVARAAKEMTDIHHVSGGVRMCPVTTQILDALKEVAKLGIL